MTSFGDSIWSFSYSKDPGLFGVEFDGEYFYVTGDNDGGDSNMIYVFDRNGSYVREFGQKTRNLGPSDWGWMGLAYRPDRDYFFGSEDSMISAFDRSGNVLYKFPGPFHHNPALAGDGEYLWATLRHERIAKVDTTGVLIASYPNPYWSNGLAWDDASEGNPWLWVSVLGDTKQPNVIYQFDPIKGEYTGVWFEGARSVPGGLAFSSDWDTSRAILFELCQYYPDYVVAYDLGPIQRTLDATVDIKPEVLNLKSKGRWVTCYIELSEGYSVEEIDRSTVAITKIDEQLLSPPMRTEGPSDIGDYDEDGIPDLMVKFSRQELISHLQEKYGIVTIFVAGELHNAREFEGSDTLRVIEPPQSNRNTMVESNRSAYTFELCQNWPSPFLTSTRISYQIPEQLLVRLTIYDLSGRLVKALIVETQSAGSYTVEWRGDDGFGRPVPAGVYLYRLDAGRWSATRKTTLIR